MKSILLVIIVTFSINLLADTNPPVAAERDHLLEKHGDVRNDEYYWLKDRKNPEVIKLLIANGAEINTMDNKQQTPLGALCSRGRSKIAKLFILCGAVETIIFMNLSNLT
jgi:ankyrin repeat protein